MCSTPEDRLARLGQAIEDLAADTRARSRGDAHDHATSQVADIWAMLADLDPELASRMARYHGPAE